MKMDFLGVSALIFAIAALLLVAFLIPTILELRRSLRQVEKTAAQLNSHLPSIVKNLDDITTHVSHITNSGKNQMQNLESATARVKNLVENVSGFERRFKKQVESPLVQSIGTLTALTRAVHTFMTVLGDRKSRQKVSVNGDR